MLAFLTLFLAVVHLLSGLTLLVFSAWFIAASAIAAPGFNYMLPAVLVRALALIRIATGYGYLYLGHEHMLIRLKDARLTLFAQLRQTHILARSQLNHTLTDNIDNVANAWIAWISPMSGALAMWLMALLVTYFITPMQLTWVAIALTAVPLLLLAIFWLTQHQQQRLNYLRKHFEAQSEDALLNAHLWHLQQQPVKLDASLIWKAELNDTNATQYGLIAIHGVGLICLSLLLIFLPQKSVGQAQLLIPIMLLLSIKDWLSAGFTARQNWQSDRSAREAIAAHQYQPIPQLDTGSIHSLQVRQLRAKDRNIPAVDIRQAIQGIILLSGSSGSGKSSLLQGIAGLIPVDGERIANNSRIGTGQLQDACYVEQYPYLFSATLFDNLAVARKGISTGEAVAALQQTHLDALSDNLQQWLGIEARTLSGGEMKRLGLARAWLSKRSVWLLDEPFEGLAASQIEHLAHWLNQQSKQHIIIIASHIQPANLTVEQHIDLDSLR